MGSCDGKNADGTLKLFWGRPENAWHTAFWAIIPIILVIGIVGKDDCPAIPSLPAFLGILWAVSAIPAAFRLYFIVPWPKEGMSGQKPANYSTLEAISNIGWLVYFSICIWGCVLVFKDGNTRFFSSDETNADGEICKQFIYITAFASSLAPIAIASIMMIGGVIWYAVYGNNSRTTPKDIENV